MTTPGHAAQGYVICRMAGMPWPMAALGAFTSASLDIPIWIEAIRVYFATGKDTRDWSIRDRTHKISAMSIRLYIILAIVMLFAMVILGPANWQWWIQLLATLPFFHWGEDLLMHKPIVGGWIKPWAHIAEVIDDLACLAWIWFKEIAR